MPSTVSLARRDFLAAGIWPLSKNTASMAGIRFRVDRHGSSPARYLQIHGDETTARDVLREAAPAGTSFFVESATRMVTIGAGRIDPNRMFSRLGAETNLRRLNPNWSEAQVANALLALDSDREKFLRALLPRKGALLVSLHNNSERYTIETEAPISQRVVRRQTFTPHEFLLATSPQDFGKLEQSGFNCVLQSNATGPDDGSLSRLCAARGIRYLNIEARLGSSGPQRAMLDWVVKNLS
jgi:hypothetical protein